jgi:hypothetical protein
MRPRTLPYLGPLAMAVAFAGCSSSHTAATKTPTPATAAPSTSGTSGSSAPSAGATGVPVLEPGQRATFIVTNSTGGSTRLTWTMGSKVVQSDTGVLGPAPKGFEYVAFNVTIKNDGPNPTDGVPTYQSAMVWQGTDGRTDNTLAGTSCACVGNGSYGLAGADLESEGSLAPGRYVTGVVG